MALIKGAAIAMAVMLVLLVVVGFEASIHAPAEPPNPYAATESEKVVSQDELLSCMWKLAPRDNWSSDRELREACYYVVVADHMAKNRPSFNIFRNAGQIRTELHAHD